MARLKQEKAMLSVISTFITADATAENARQKATEAFESALALIVKHGIRKDNIISYFIASCDAKSPWPTADADEVEKSNGQTKLGSLLGVNKAATKGHAVAKRCKSFLNYAGRYQWTDDVGIILVDDDGEPLKKVVLETAKQKEKRLMQEAVDTYRGTQAPALQAIINKVTANNEWTADKLELVKAITNALGVPVKIPKTVKRTTDKSSRKVSNG